MRAVLPETYWEDALKTLQSGHALLVAMVDETEAFKARELLDEETRSLQTLILPPEPADRLKPAQQALDKAVPQEATRPVDERAGDAREHALHQEQTVHEL